MAVQTMTAPGARASRREWTGLAVLALPTLLLSLDMSVLFLALPNLSADLGATATQQLWIMDVYGFMIAGAERSLLPCREVTPTVPRGRVCRAERSHVPCRGGGRVHRRTPAPREPTGRWRCGTRFA